MKIKITLLFSLLMGFVNAQQWEDIGASAPFAGLMMDVQELTILDNGHPVVAYVEQNAPSVIKISEWTGSQWVVLSSITPGIPSPFSDLNLINIGNILYLGIGTTSAPGFPYEAYRKDGATWTNLDDGSLVSMNYTSGTVKMEASEQTDDVVITFSAFGGGSGDLPNAYKYDGSSWDINYGVDLNSVFLVDPTTANETNPFASNIFHNGPNTYYFSNQSDPAGGGFDELRLYKLDAGTWNVIPFSGFDYIESDPTFKFSIAGDPAGGFPTIAYVGNSNPNAVKFQQMDGVGNYTPLADYNPGFSISTLDIAIDNANSPYIAVIDNSSSNANKVLNYNGTGWDQVGTLNFETTALVGNLDIEVSNASNKVYILYDTDSGSRMKVYNNAPTTQSYTVTNTCQDGGLSTVVSNLTFNDIDNDSVYVVSVTSSDLTIVQNANIVMNRVVPYNFNSSQNVFDLNITSETGKTGPVDISIAYSDGLVTSTDIISFTVNTLPTIFAGADQTVCAGDNVTLSGSGGVSYVWNNGVTDGVPFTIAAGTYSYVCTGTDINGCSTTDAVNIIVSPSPNFATSVTDIICNGNADGQINLAGLSTSTSYNIEYTYLSSPVSNTITSDGVGNISIYSLPSGNYTNIIVTDNGTGCISATDAGPYTINEPSVITIFGEANQTICEGSTVTLNGNAVGGTGTLTYTWDNSITDGTSFTPSLGSLPYTLTATDLNGCFTSMIVLTINVNASTPIFTVSSTNPTTCGGTDGDISLNGLTPSTAYNVTYNDGTTQGPTSMNSDASGIILISGLSAAAYTNFDVTNVNACTTSNAGPISLTDPGAPFVSPVSNVTVCPGNTVGTITFSGTAGASFDWINDDISIGLSASGVASNMPSFTASNAGSTPVIATITVTPNLGGCTGASTNYTITVNPLDDANFTYSSSDYCLNDTDPIPTIALVGGTFSNTIVSGGPFVVNNSNGTINLTSSISGVVDITYATIGSCPNSSTVSITLNDVPNLSNPMPLTVCLNDGPLDLNGSVTPTGGVYAGSFVGNNNFNPLNSGVGNSFIYNYLYSDINGCTSSTSSTIDVLDIPIIGLTITNTACGNMDGSAISNVTGGATPYNYYWSNGTSGQEITNLGPNTYYLNITDNNNCYVMAVATIQSSEISLTGIITDNLCNGLSNGFIDLTVSGTSGPYTYYWSNGETTEDINNLIAGEYEVFVTDANGCISTISFNVNEPTLISTSINTVNTTNCGTTDGSLTASVLGGTAPYSYIWTDNTATTVSTSNIAANLGGGLYVLNITDINGCTEIINGQVSENGGPTIILNQVLASSCSNDGSIDIGISSVNTIQSVLWSNAEVTEDISDLPADYYTLTVTDINGCTGSFGVEVEPIYPSPIEICIVTVDTSTNTNKVVWTKPISSEIDYFIIYRETSVAGEFLPVDTVQYSELSEFTDPVAYPQLRSWRYRISVVNNCGIESAHSPAHKTIHVTISQIIAGTYVVNWDNYEGFSFSGFDVFRFTTQNGWEPVTNTTDFTITDTPTNTDGIDYMISITPPSTCNVTKAIDHNASRSNTTASITLPPGSNGGVGVEESNLENLIQVFPNPSTGQFNISLGLNVEENYIVNLYDLKGSLVKSFNMNSPQFMIDLKDFESGMYILEINLNYGVIRKQLIKK